MAINPTSPRLVVALAGFCLLGHGSGCGGAAGLTGDERAARGVLKVLGIEYGNFAASHGKKPPADKAELVAFLEARQDRIRGLKNVDQLFVSPRDNQPLVIFYGEKMPPADESGYPLIAHEKTGESSQCLVANTRGGVTELAREEIPTYFGSVK